MFTYTGTTSIQMAKHYRAEQATSTSRAPRVRTLRTRRFTPPSVLTSRWWVASDGPRNGRPTGQGGTARAAW